MAEGEESLTPSNPYAIMLRMKRPVRTRPHSGKVTVCLSGRGVGAMYVLLRGFARLVQYKALRMRHSIVENVWTLCGILLNISRPSQLPYSEKSKKHNFIIIYSTNTPPRPPTCRPAAQKNNRIAALSWAPLWLSTCT